jgi:hypothetical protein
LVEAGFITLEMVIVIRELATIFELMHELNVNTSPDLAIKQVVATATLFILKELIVMEACS